MKNLRSVVLAGMLAAAGLFSGCMSTHHNVVGETVNPWAANHASQRVVSQQDFNNTIKTYNVTVTPKLAANSESKVWNDEHSKDFIENFKSRFERLVFNKDSADVTINVMPHHFNDVDRMKVVLTGAMCLVNLCQSKSEVNATVTITDRNKATLLEVELDEKAGLEAPVRDLMTKYGSALVNIGSHGGSGTNHETSMMVGQQMDMIVNTKMAGKQVVDMNYTEISVDYYRNLEANASTYPKK